MPLVFNFLNFCSSTDEFDRANVLHGQARPFYAAGGVGLSTGDACRVAACSQQDGEQALSVSRAANELFNRKIE